MIDVQYLYCISEDGGDDFITISYTFINNIITIFSFEQEFNIKDVRYVAIDYSSDPFISFNKKYTNSGALTFYNVKFIEEDADRMTVTFTVIGKVDEIDLLKYKRETKIRNIINE